MDNGINLETLEKKKRIHADRIVVAQQSLEILKEWKDQITKEVKGLKVSIADLLNWLIQKQSKVLSPQQVRELSALFFDEVKFAEWVTRELKAAKARGEVLTLQDLVQSHQNPVPRKYPEKSKRHRKELTEEQPVAAPTLSSNLTEE